MTEKKPDVKMTEEQRLDYVIRVLRDVEWGYGLCYGLLDENYARVERSLGADDAKYIRMSLELKYSFLIDEHFKRLLPVLKEVDADIIEPGGQTRLSEIEQEIKAGRPMGEKRRGLFEEEFGVKPDGGKKFDA